MNKVLIGDTLKDATPELLAEMFCAMDSVGQAAFFNHIDKISSPWLVFQLQHITDEHGLTLAGRRVMQYIGEYSHWGLLRADPNYPLRVTK